MEGSVLSFLKEEWKVNDTGSAHWASSFIIALKEVPLGQAGHPKEGQNSMVLGKSVNLQELEGAKFPPSVILNINYYRWSSFISNVIWKEHWT
jgi:hypothetical protein